MLSWKSNTEWSSSTSSSIYDYFRCSFLSYILHIHPGTASSSSHCTAQDGGGQRIHFYMQLLLRSVLFVEHGYCSFLWQTWSIHAGNVPVVGIIMPFDWMGNNSTRRWWWWCLYGSQQSLEGYTCIRAATQQHNNERTRRTCQFRLRIQYVYYLSRTSHFRFHSTTAYFQHETVSIWGMHGNEDIIAHPRLSLLSWIGKEMAVQKDFRPKEITTSGERITFANRSFMWSFAINFPQYVYRNDDDMVWRDMTGICMLWVDSFWLRGDMYTERLLSCESCESYQCSAVDSSLIKCRWIKYI